MSFEEIEDKTGVRVTWNHVPKLKLQHQRNVAPLAAFLTPLNNKSPIQVLDEAYMARCRQCQAFLNPYVSVNPQTGDIWYCQFCTFGNRLQADGSYPPALSPECASVEYVTRRQSPLPPIFFFVVDTCFENEDVGDAFESLKETLALAVSLLPSGSLVGFISFGKHVQLHDVSVTNRAHTFNGEKEYTLEEVQKILRLSGSTNAMGQLSSGRRFLHTIDVVEYNLLTIIEGLVNITFPHNESKTRAARASGCAVNIAALTLQALLGKVGASGGHILTFLAGAATVGPGKIVNLPLREPIRSHHDIEKAKATTLANLAKMPNLPHGVAKADLALFKKARPFYQKVARVLVSIGISCNFFVGSYDQMGLYEMEDVCSNTGGMVVMCDLFSTLMFRQSVGKFFAKRSSDAEGADNELLDMGFNATLECRTTPDLQVQGLIGNAAGLPPRKDKFVEAGISAISVGEGGTNAWKLLSINPQLTFAVYLDKLDSPAVDRHAFLQATCHYQHPDNTLRVRVTTVPLAVIADSDGAALEQGFDQEAATVAIARNALAQVVGRPSLYAGSAKSTYDQQHLSKHLDKLLVDFCVRFAQYRKGDMQSFRLSNCYAMLPQFMYHLRRSPFICVFNNSPDETSFIRHSLMHEDVTNALIMIQPSLLLYDVDQFDPEQPDPEPVLLDLMSLGASKILLLDTFFQILIYHGKTVALWRNAGYHEQDGYEHFKAFLEAPKREAMEILLDRFPLPRFIDCDEGGSQARFLMAKVNPSTSYMSTPDQMFGVPNHSDVKTDDKSLQLFMESIQRIIVAKK